VSLIGPDGTVKSQGDVIGTINIEGVESPKRFQFTGGAILGKMAAGDRLLWTAVLSCRKVGKDDRGRPTSTRKCLASDDCDTFLE
jgi:hypothetical protein